MKTDEEKFKYYDFIIQVLDVCKIGLKYSKDPYALVNYQKLLGIGNEMLKDLQNVDFSSNPFFKRDIYPTPNISVRTAIFNDKNEVLLVREKSDGGYSLPGGWCDLYDSPSGAAIRECKEEAGADVKITKLIGILNRTPFKNKQNVPEYVVLFRGELIGPLKNHDHEISEVHFFDVDNLPQLSLKVTREEMVKMIKTAQKGDVIYD